MSSDPSNSVSAPESALEHAQAALRLGMHVTEIEKLLIARGLAPDAAASVVMNALESRVKETMLPENRAARRQLLHRILSSIVSCLCLALAYVSGGGFTAALTLVRIIMPVGIIWYANEIGAWVRTRREYNVFANVGPAPTGLARFLCWLYLLVVAMNRITGLFVTTD
jgi:hypothetical protein